MVLFRHAPEPVQQQRFYRHQSNDQTQDGERPVRHEAEIHGHPDGDEKQTKQQSFERFDVGFEFVAVFGIRQQHAREKRSQGHRQAGQLHQ